MEPETSFPAPLNNLSAHLPEQHPAQTPQPIAPWWHTALLLAQLIALSFIGPAASRARISQPHLPLYIGGIMSQWLQLSAAVAGMYRRRQFFLDTLQRGKGTWFSESLLGVALFIVTIVVFGIATGAMRATQHAPGFDKSVLYAMAPANASELLLWLLLSLVVGFCEEHVFRGYLLQQVLLWAARIGASPRFAAVVAVFSTSILFGCLHVYEGTGGAILIGILGAMYSVVALRRGNLRAVIVAHALQDSLAMIFIMLRNAHHAH